MQPPARLLDITRLINRAGLQPTGVDRVEVAYLRALLAESIPVFGVARTALGFVLVDRAGAAQVLHALKTDEWGKPDLFGRFNPRLSTPRRLGQSFIRKHAIARCARHKLRKTLAAHLPTGFTYLNVGHSNLNKRMFDAVGGAHKAILIHDTIPLDHPQTQAVGAVDAFKAKLLLVSKRADTVICTSTQCALDVTRHLGDLGHVPDMITALLGVDVPAPDKEMQRPTGPYFVTVGTIEPRKNHALLLDIWADWSDAPPLVICGKRGWNNAAVFERLDGQPAQVIEHNNLSDGQIAALVGGATAMLFPSSAEGFGLPPAEALALGTRVVCASLPVYGEILGDCAVYVDACDRCLWEKTIKNLAATGRPDHPLQFVPPTWAAHFKRVLSKV